MTAAAKDTTGVGELKPKYNPSPKTVLFARITKRSPLRCFARSDDEVAYPFQANLEVCSIWLKVQSRTQIARDRLSVYQKAGVSDILRPVCHAAPQISDGEDRAIVVLWYRAVCDYFARLRVGDIVALANFRVRRATGFVADFSDAPIEIALNSQNPTGVLRLVREKDIGNLVRFSK